MKKAKIMITLFLVLVLSLENTLNVLAYDKADAYSNYDDGEFPVIEEETEYTYHLCYWTTANSGNRLEIRYYTVKSDEEVVVGMRSYKNGRGGLEFLSNGEPIYVRSRKKNIDPDKAAWWSPCCISEDTQTVIKRDKDYLYYIDSQTLIFKNVLKSDMKIFDSDDNAILYLNTGEEVGLLRGEDKEYKADEVYLDNFYMEVHDSNKLENFYIEFFYTPSPAMMEDLDNSYINVGCKSQFEYESTFGLIKDGDNKDFNFIISLKDNPTSYRYYPKASDFGQTDMYVFERMILGDELFLDFDKLNISIGDTEIGLNDVVEITKSRIMFELNPISNGIYGMRYSATVDFLNPSSSYYNSSTPDTSGNYTSDGNYTQNDKYYYTEVGNDYYGNVTYKYYEIDSHNRTTTEIDNSTGGEKPSDNSVIHYHYHKWEGNAPSGGSSGDDLPDVVINDDDYTNQTLRDSLRDGFGLFDDLSTEKKNDGFLSMLSFFFTSIDKDLSALIGFGITSIVTVNILRSIFKR